MDGSPPSYQASLVAKKRSQKRNFAASASGTGPKLPPRSMTVFDPASKAGQLNNPGPLGLPVLGLLAQQEDIISAIFRSSSVQGSLVSARLLNTWLISDS